MILSKIFHLSKSDIIKNGSIFTPDKIVEIAKNWTQKYISKTDYIIDFGVGYGSFISKFTDLCNNCIATDIDSHSIQLVGNLFPTVRTILENSLVNINRAKYGISEESKLIIIGNPPYNDFTSQFKKGEKGQVLQDPFVKSRDLGISFLKMYSILKPNFICVLHPLSYLIKKTNFNSLGSFKNHYRLIRGLIFSSRVFESIKKSKIEFPVVLAIYEASNKGMNEFSYVEKFPFEIIESIKTFSLVNFKTIDGWVNKYPSKRKSEGDLLFYTLRDINALKRNRTFLKGKVSNGIKVDIPDLYKYAWLDYFKNHFNTSNDFLFGNLSPLYDSILDSSDIKKELISFILESNKVVKDHFSSLELLSQLKKHYKIIKFVNYFPLLQKLMEKLVKL